jgi:uncharacterized protein
MTGDPVTETNDGILLSVRLSPKARQAAIGDIALDANGAPSLRIAVTAPAEDGKANTALIALLAKRWKLAKSQIALVSGAASRNKKIRITGDAAMLSHVIEQTHKTKDRR